MDAGLSEELAQQIDITIFGYGSLIDKFNVVVATSKYKNLGENKIELEQVIDGNLKTYEAAGAQNIITKKDKFVTPNGAEGLKVYGTLQMPIPGTESVENGKYVLLAFTSENVVQQVSLTWKEGDSYADQIIERILNSVELKPAEE